MSRLGKIPVPILKGVQVTIQGKSITIKGPKGTLKIDLIPEIEAKVEDQEIVVALTKGNLEKSNLHGLFRQLIHNMVFGVFNGFEKRLQMIGVGYRAAVQGNLLDLQIGKSHPTKVKIPEGIEVKIDKGTNLSIIGCDKRLVGQFAADIREYKRPEPYKGKGIRYEDEYVRRKAGKAGKK